ncbi:MAG: DUF2844 domain-containing protein [Rhodoferax sp.]|nr:DUF2844 domain-containing protein [Rhodoferax sp.]
MTLRYRHRLVTAALAGLLCASGAWARLGGDAASVVSDGLALGASTSQSKLVGATLYTQTLPNGLTLRQYVNAAGLVFAVGWEGPVLPDFERLLGPYFAAYDTALRQQRRGVNVQAADLVIESGGMMRSFNGRAYLPPGVPATLPAQDIR